jgi:hypothetical protein
MIDDLCSVTVRFNHGKKPIILTGAMELTFKRKDLTAVRFELLDAPFPWGELAHTPYNLTAIDNYSVSLYMWNGARFGVPEIYRMTGMVAVSLESWERASYLGRLANPQISWAALKACDDSQASNRR